MKKVLILFFAFVVACNAEHRPIVWVDNGVQQFLGAGGPGVSIPIPVPDPTPTPTADLILECLWIADDATDTSGQGNDGVVSGTTWNTMTNGIGAYRAMGSTGTVTVTISGTKTGYSFFARTNDLWRFYEVKNGTEYVDLALEDFDPTDFYSVSGDVITIGGADHDINNFEAYSVSNNSAQSVSNFHRYAVDTGTGSKASRDNDLNSTKVLDVTMDGDAANAQDGSTNNASLTVTAVTAWDGGNTNGGAILNGSTSFINAGDKAVYSFGDGSTDDPFTFVTAVNPDATPTSTEGFVAKFFNTSDRAEYLFGQVSGGQVVIALYDFGTGHQINFTTTAALPPNVWTMVAVSYAGDGSTFKIYFNGIEQAGSFGSVGSYVAMHNTAASLNIGRAEYNNLYYDGKQDEVRMYASQLSSNNIYDMALSEYPLFGYIAGIETNSWWDSVVFIDTYNAQTLQDYKNGYHGTGTAITYSGFGHIVLNGSTSYINKLDRSAWSFVSSDFSGSAWVNPDTITSKITIFAKGSDSSNLEYSFRIDDNGKIDVLLYDQSSGNRLTFKTDASLPSADTWYHLAFAYDYSEDACVIYVNGAEWANTSATAGTFVTMRNTSTDLTIGQFVTAGQFFDGEIDMPTLYDKELSAAEVLSIYNLGRPSQ